MRRLVILALVSIAVPARADRATKLKRQGIVAARHHDWKLARERFAQSYALSRRPLTLFNLAVAQERTGQLIEARASYAAFLAATHPGHDAQFRKLATAALAKLDRRIPTVELALTGFTGGVTVALDGRTLGAGALAKPVPVTAGDHSIVVSRGGKVLVRKQVNAAEGSHAHVELAPPPPPVVTEPLPVRPPPHEVPVPPPPPAPAVPTPAPAVAISAPARRPHHGHSILASGWFWGITAAVVLSAAGASYYHFVIDGPGTPTNGTLVPGAIHVP